MSHNMDVDKSEAPAAPIESISTSSIPVPMGEGTPVRFLDVKLPSEDEGSDLDPDYVMVDGEDNDDDDDEWISSEDDEDESDDDIDVVAISSSDEEESDVEKDVEEAK